MRIFPIIPIWIMLFISIVLILIIFFSKSRNYIHLCIIILLFLINLRIMIPKTSINEDYSNLNILFVIDNTISMNALDYNGDTRLSAVKEDCKYIIGELQGANFSIITFNNKTRLNIPFTNDINSTINVINLIEVIDPLYAKGSSLNVPYNSLKQSLSNSKRTNILFFISDGEITDNSSLMDYSDISKYIVDGAVLGYGTSKGGFMKNSIDNGYLFDYTNNYNEKAISRLNEKSLKKLSNDLDIKYIYMNKQFMIDSKIKDIKAISRRDNDNIINYIDIYYIFAIPIFLLLLIDYYNLRRKYI